MGWDPGRWCLQTQADSHVTTSFHSVAGLPTAFLPLRKDSPLRIGFSPGCRAGLHLLACGDGRHCGWQGAGLLGAVLPAVNGLMIQVVGPGVGCVTLETWRGWAGMRFGLLPQGFVFGDREGQLGDNRSLEAR